jgi:16S rRNA (uracil1498-N3)-methyltransferase
VPRLHCPVPLAAGAELALPAGAARHVQVLRLQPGNVVTLFNGEGGQWAATILHMGRSDVHVRVDAHEDVERESPRPAHLAIGMPANERMDWLVEKATELGMASIQPLHTAHGVLRLSGERAHKKQAHWQAIAVAACEQCGRNRVPVVLPVATLDDWLAATAQRVRAQRWVMSLREGHRPLQVLAGDGRTEAVEVLLGPEGGLSGREEDLALAAGFRPASLGPRVLRAETAALAALVTLTN